MRDGYVGDIGDFSKYGLLRHLWGVTGDPIDGVPLPLGIIWYLNPRPPDYDGNYVGYLMGTPGNKERFRDYDPYLYDKLQELVPSDKRSIESVCKAGILPPNTPCYEKPLPTGSRRKDDDWFKGALEKTAEAKVVFVDPDNGIAPDEAKAGPQHVSIAELRRLWNRGQSLIIVPAP